MKNVARALALASAWFALTCTALAGLDADTAQAETQADMEGGAASTHVHGPEPLPDALERGGRGDGVYGRFDGAWALAVGAGFEATPTSGTARPNAIASLRFYQTAGLSLAFAQAVDDGDPIERSLSATTLIEPLFLLRWSGDHEWGQAFWDLALDSLSLSLGAVIATPRGGTFGDAAGFRLGLGAGLPLFAKANGPWLRLGGRMDTGQAAGVVGAFWANLEWQGFFPGGAPE